MNQSIALLCVFARIMYTAGAAIVPQGSGGIL